MGVENALKTAFDWKVRKNIASGKGEKGSKVIHFKECFHGRTGYTMSLTDSPDPRKTLYFPQFDWPRVDNPKLEFPITDDVLHHVKIAEDKVIQQIVSAVHNNPDEIACLIIEPIQGEGGDNHLRQEFFQQLRALADEHEFLLIYDEVQTGVGVTGNMWAHQQFSESCRPDIISFGKKTLYTRSLMIADLSKEESLKLQEEGVGDKKLYGCGIFLPHKSIDAVNNFKED